MPRGKYKRTKNHSIAISNGLRRRNGITFKLEKPPKTMKCPYCKREIAITESRE